MLLLAIPMYVAPFVVISLMSFAMFVAVPKLRRFAVAALVAPVAFGGCAAAGFISWILLCAILKIELLWPMTGLRGILEGIAFYFAPGVLGALTAIWIANKSVWVWQRIPIAPSWIERTSAAEAASSETI